MEKSDKQITIYDIAEKANVSATTVSRVLNQKGYVAQEKREQILKIAEDLQYKPNQLARMLKNQRTNQIMLSIPDMRNSFYNDFIDSVSKRAEENNYSLLLNYNQMREATKMKMLDDLAQNHFDGLILVSIYLTKSMIERIDEIKKPIVLTSISSQPPIQWKGRYDYVGVDTRAAMYMSTKHLIENGHKKIAYVGIDQNSLTGQERLEGYTLALKEADITPNSAWIFKQGYDEEFGYQSMKQILSTGDLPTAVCACNDVISVGVYKALEEANISIPEEMCVVGMDDSDISKIIRPRLSSVSLCSSELGDAAARLIFKRLDDGQKRIENVLFEPKLNIRDSSKITLR